MLRNYLFTFLLLCFSLHAIPQETNSVIERNYKEMTRNFNIVEKEDDVMQDSLDRAQRYFEKGVSFGEKEDYESSQEFFNKAIEVNHLYAKAFLYRGLTKIELGNYEGAIKDFSINIDLDSHYSDQAYFFRGIAKYHKHDYDGAIQDLTIAIKLNPEHEAFYERGRAYLAINEYGMALQDFDSSYRLNPGFEKIHLYRAIGLYHIGQYKSAVEDINIAKNNLPDDPKVYYYSGLIRIGLQNSYVAIEELNRCIELDPNHSRAYKARAEARVNTGNRRAARSDAKKVEMLAAEEGTVSETTQVSEPASEPKQKREAESLDIAKYFASAKQEKQKQEEEPTQKDVLDNDQNGDEIILQTDDLVDDDQSIDEETTELAFERERSKRHGTRTSRRTFDNISSLPPGFYNPQLQEYYPEGFGIQVASYSSTSNLHNLVKAYEYQFEKPVFVNVSYVNNQKLYRVIIGEFDNRKKAEYFRDNIRRSHFADSFLVSFERLY